MGLCAVTKPCLTADRHGSWQPGRYVAGLYTVVENLFCWPVHKNRGCTQPTLAVGDYSPQVLMMMCGMALPVPLAKKEATLIFSL